MFESKWAIAVWHEIFARSNFREFRRFPTIHTKRSHKNKLQRKKTRKFINNKFVEARTPKSLCGLRVDLSEVDLHFFSRVLLDKFARGISRE